MAIVCYACGHDVGARERIGRADRCARCGVDLHSCRQCRFYDPRVYNGCAEPQAERVLEKDRANFCDYFVPAVDRAPPDGQAGKRVIDAAGKGGERAGRAAAPGDARADLERLFRRR